MRTQLNLFGIEKIDVGECINLTIESLNTYGPMHNHWAIAWSWGKDSTTLLTLIVQLINTGQISPPKTLTVLCSDTRMELTPLWLSAMQIIAKLTERGVNVKIVSAEVDHRFLVYILGRGVPPPSNTFRWCTGKIKIDPMNQALEELILEKGEKILMLTGVRIGESAIRDQRISVSCSKDGAECGQGWYQYALEGDMCATLAPILHWRVCNVWDWLKIFAPMERFGAWPTKLLADAYGGDEAEEINARTGCIGCPLASKDKALNTVVSMDEWKYLRPLLGLKIIYREMKMPQHRLRKVGGDKTKSGKLSKNQQRMGPLTIDARLMFLQRIIDIQNEVNTTAEEQGKPRIDILNSEEISRIRELISLNTFPDGWTGSEPSAAEMHEKVYSDGSVMPLLFKI
jgi:DNA sulfur modification protein DndC